MSAGDLTDLQKRELEIESFESLISEYLIEPYLSIFWIKLKKPKTFQDLLNRPDIKGKDKI